MKRTFRPPGRAASPTKAAAIEPTLDTVYTPPRAFVRDHSSRFGRPTRDNRRSISTTIAAPKEPKPALKPAGQAAKVKSMYDLSAAASRQLNSKPSLPSLTKNRTASKAVERRPSFEVPSPQTGLMKARSPGENVIAICSKPAKHVAKVPAVVKKSGTTANQSQKRESAV